jgi:AcrR family transcriptional regulator
VSETARSRGRLGGRPAQISLEDIERAALEIGLSRLTVQGVATALGVTPTALYRHVDGKLGLERLVGEAVLAELQLVDEPADTASEYLLSLAHQMRTFTLAHPGMTAYLQSIFPRGESGARLMRSGIESLVRRGYTPDVAGVMCSGVATVAIALAAAEERHEVYADSRERTAAEAALASDSVLTASQQGLPTIDFDMYFRMVLTAFIQGLTTAAPTGRPLPEILQALGFEPS